MSTCTPSWLEGLGMSASTHRQSPFGIPRRSYQQGTMMPDSPHSPEESPTCQNELLTVTTLTYANGAEITTASGARLTHFFLAVGTHTAYLGWAFNCKTLIYTNGAGITVAACARLTHFFLAGGSNTACLGWGLVLHAWEWVPALPTLLPGWGITLLRVSITCLGMSICTACTPS